MKIERTTEGVMHVIEGDRARTIKFESRPGCPLLQFLSTISSNPGGDPGYNVTRYPNARITLLIEVDDPPDYAQAL